MLKQFIYVEIGHKKNTQKSVVELISANLLYLEGFGNALSCSLYLVKIDR